MPYYLLEPSESKHEDPWNVYDGCQSIVVCAKDEKEARQLASDEHLAEGPTCWLDSKLSSCIDISLDETPRVIIQDVNWG
jgi:hypothetical protein